MPVIFLLLALAADPQLEAIRAQLEPMRVHPEKIAGPRGATPELTVVKHGVRDWVESRLKSFDGKNTAEFERQLNQELLAAELVYGTHPPEWFNNGYLSDVRVSRQSSYLAVITGVGIECGFDDSVYLFAHRDGAWTRAWVHEQNDYENGKYKPQYVSGLQTWNDLVLTLGRQTWCASNWHNIYYRLYRLGSDQPVIDGGEWAYTPGFDPIRARLKENDLLVEYEIAGVEGGFTRPAVFHYEISGQNAKRIPPVALDPRSFVQEWIRSDWSEAGQWTQPASRPVLAKWHERLRDEHGSYGHPTTHCATQPDVWQVNLDYGDAAYFFVRWTPPYRFTMVRISADPSPDCRRPDPEADADHTLFSDWR